MKPMDGGPARQITAVPSAHESWPRWTPDGRAIVYRDQAPGGGLFLLRRNSALAWGVPESLRPEADWLGAWLPDGRAAYTRHGAVEVISIGTRQVQVVYAPSGGAADPLVEMISSVDGRRLYFKSHDADGRAAIWRVPASGGRLGVSLPTSPWRPAIAAERARTPGVPAGLSPARVGHSQRGLQARASPADSYAGDP